MPTATTDAGIEAPLAGVLVVEDGAGFAVAYAGRMLAGFGATVVKLESGEGGDIVRATGPDLGGGVSAMHAYLNAGKQSVTLDRGGKAGRGLLRKLLAGADMVLRFREPVADELPAHGAIEVNISWLGLSGPWSKYGCDDFLAQHVSGMSFTSALRVPDTATHPPKAAPAHLAEMVAGLTAATAGVVALLGRDGGAGSDRIDISVAESIVSFMRYETVIYSYGWGLPSRSKLARSPVAAPVFQQAAADGYVDMLIMQEDPWRALLSVLGNPAWGEDEIFATHPSRSAYWDALEPLLQEELRKHTAMHLFREGQARGVAIAPINTIAQAATAEQFELRRFFQPQTLDGGETLVPGLPFRIGEPLRVAAAPALGQHNQAVFVERLGCSPAELAAAGAGV